MPYYSTKGGSDFCMSPHSCRDRFPSRPHVAFPSPKAVTLGCPTVPDFHDFPEAVRSLAIRLSLVQEEFDSRMESLVCGRANYFFGRTDPPTITRRPSS